MPRYAPFLLAAYVFLLPFQRLGIPFLGHRVAPADVLLALAFLAALPVWRRSDPASLLSEPLRWLPLCLAGFIAAGLLSAVASPSPETGLRALLPYVYALVLIAAFGPILSVGNTDAHQSLVAAAAGSVGVMAFAGFFPGALPTDWETLAFDSGFYAIFDKYRFLLEGSTQLAILALVSFAIVTLARIDSRPLPVPAEIVFPGLCLGLVLISGSRVATPAALLLVGAFHLAQWRDVRVAPAGHRAGRLRILWASVAFATVLVSWQAGIRSNPTVRRSLSGVLELAVRVVPPLSRFIVAEPFRRERIDESLRSRREMNAAGARAFLEHPVLGGGLGQVRDDLDREVHNTVLGVAAEMGLVGLAALLPILVLLARPLLRPGDRFRRGLQALVLGAVLLPHGFHFLLRERWMWLFALVFLSAVTRPARGGPVDGPEARL